MAISCASLSPHMHYIKSEQLYPQNYHSASIEKLLGCWPKPKVTKSHTTLASVVHFVPERCVCVCVGLQVFREAQRSVPSVIYMPHVSDWWEAISETVKSTFLTLLQDVPSFTPLLILATAEISYQQLPEEVRTPQLLLNLPCCSVSLVLFHRVLPLCQCLMY